MEGGTYDGSVPSVEMAAASMISFSRAKGETTGVGQVTDWWNETRGDNIIENVAGSNNR